MADKGSVRGTDWYAKQEQTKNTKGQSADWKACIRDVVRAWGLVYVHRELKRLEVSDITGLLVSPFRKCDCCHRMKAYPRELCSVGHHKRVVHHCQYCCVCDDCESRKRRLGPVPSGRVKRRLFQEPRDNGMSSQKIFEGHLRTAQEESGRQLRVRKREHGTVTGDSGT